MEENKDNFILVCDKLNKKIGKKQILTDVSLDIKAGDILGFIGPNGAGKTTTIKLILGLQSINSGKVIINGYDIEKNFEKAIERVGAIVENPDQYMYLSGMDNLKLVSNMYKDIDKSRIDEVIKLVGLENRIKDKVSKYSLGMRQRLGIAVALLHKPNLLILDEPTNGLDPEGIKDLRNLLKKLAREEKMGILISSHNLSELESFCTRVAIIQAGKMVESSSMADAKKVAGKSIYVIEVDNISKAKELIKKDTEETSEENIIKVFATKEEIPEIVSALVKNDVKIYKVCEDEISLESAFLKKTGGNVIE